jgi:hypothetical protein
MGSGAALVSTRARRLVVRVELNVLVNLIQKT